MASQEKAATLRPACNLNEKTNECGFTHPVNLHLCGREQIRASGKTHSFSALSTRRLHNTALIQKMFQKLHTV